MRGPWIPASQSFWIPAIQPGSQDPSQLGSLTLATRGPRSKPTGVSGPEPTGVLDPGQSGSLDTGQPRCLGRVSRDTLTVAGRVPGPQPARFNWTPANRELLDPGQPGSLNPSLLGLMDPSLWRITDVSGVRPVGILGPPPAEVRRPCLMHPQVPIRLGSVTINENHIYEMKFMKVDEKHEAKRIEIILMKCEEITSRS